MRAPSDAYVNDFSEKLPYLATHMRFDPFGKLREQLSDETCGKIR